MRTPLATLAMLLVGLPCLTVWSQTPDPFSQRDRTVRDDPFGGDANPVPRPTLDAPANQTRNARRTSRTPNLPGALATAGGNNVGLRDARAGTAVSSATPSETRMKIQSALDSKTTQTFIQVPLSEAMQVLSDTHDIPVIIDRRGLEEIGLDADAGVAIDMKNMSLRGFLRLMLRDLDLTYMVRDEYLEITTIEAAEDRLITEMYVLPDAMIPKSEDVIKVLSASVNPNTWEAQGGSSNAIAFDHVLIVSTTSDTHDAVGRFLENLARKYGEPKRLE